jgi:hypothetical protein
MIHWSSLSPGRYIGCVHTCYDQCFVPLWAAVQWEVRPFLLEQRFPNCGPRTTGGPRVLPLWSS